MKNLSLKSVFAALVAMFLVVSLVGCGGENGSTQSRKTASNGNVYDPTRVEVTIHKGSTGFTLKYSDRSQRERILLSMKKEGIAIKDIRTYDSGNDFVTIEPFLQDEVFVLDLTGVRDFSEKGYGGFAWSPTNGERLS